MIRLWAGLRPALGSFAGRLTLLLTVGIASASIVSLLVAERVRVHDFQRVQLDQVVDSTADLAARYARAPGPTDALLQSDRILGARPAERNWPPMQADRELSRLLAARLGTQSDAQAMPMSQKDCFPNFDLAARAAGIASASLPQCWYVTFHDSGGIERRLSIDLMAFHLPPSSTLGPLSLSFVVVASIILSMIVARFATAPLRRLTGAAQAFSVTVDPEPIPEGGPTEVRAALETFNLMQSRVRAGFRERTQILAAVTHDLQTPLTRLRLRLEQVGDDALRERLIGDLAVTQKLVQDGLELARSSESREPWSVVDIDSILSSVAEDAAEFGANVQFITGCGLQARIKPNALVRCLVNLVDNAIAYAGDAELSCGQHGGGLMIKVRDHGPGIAADALAEMFEPFKRKEGEAHRERSGSGLGLAIARAQAKTFGATLTLHNHEDGGLVACIYMKLDQTSRFPNES